MKKQKISNENKPVGKEEVSDIEEEVSGIEEEVSASLFFTPGSEKEPLPRNIGIFSDIDEEVASDVVQTLLVIDEDNKKQIELDDEPGLEPDPINLYVSTWGGIALDAFGIYDVMRVVKNTCEIHTVGIGKVMSAGVLLLAAGTKGERSVGANCRVMLHSVTGASHGAIHNLENEMEEVRWVQRQFIKCLVEETNMTEKQLKRLLSKKLDIYLTAEEAVKYGIADKIF